MSGVRNPNPNLVLRNLATENGESKDYADAIGSWTNLTCDRVRRYYYLASHRRPSHIPLTFLLWESWRGAAIQPTSPVLS